MSDDTHHNRITINTGTRIGGSVGGDVVGGDKQTDATEWGKATKYILMTIAAVALIVALAWGANVFNFSGLGINGGSG